MEAERVDEDEAFIGTQEAWIYWDMSLRMLAGLHRLGYLQGA